jgi:hypothetical protein
MAIFLKRDTKVYLEKQGPTETVIWEIPVLDGFTFSQGNVTSEVTLNEMGDASGNSKRGRRAFNDALAPAEWSFSTYIRPFTSSGTGDGKADDTSGVHHAIEEALWANFVGTGAPVEVADAYTFALANITADTTDSNISFAASNKVELGTFNLYFVMGATNATSTNYTASPTLEIYKLTNCVVNEATINFEVDGIAMIDWSGNASTLTTVAAFNASFGQTNVNVVTEGVTSTTNFIRNKLTALSLVANTGVTRTTFPGASSNGVYNITLTGGSITFSNNITYLTPETLGIVNIPIGHITGNKAISGNFTCYVDSGTAGDSGSLFDAATSANARGIITNSFEVIFKLGGSAGVPRMEVRLPTAHLTIPTIQTEDVISVDVSFEGLPSTITSNDEADITYVGA